jgi:heme exporter protein A
MPDEGCVRWCGEPVTGSANYAGELNFIGHQPALNGELDAVENLRFLAAVRPLAPACAVEHALACFAAGDFARLAVRQLSAGQRQRVSLARLVLFAARVWMLDEPFTALDRDARRVLESLIDRHAANGGLTVIATHQRFALASAVTHLDLDHPAA